MNETTKAKETAEAILIVIRTIAKWIAIVLVVIASLFAAFLAYNYFTEERARQQRIDARAALKREVEVSAVFDPQSCSRQQPFKIEFRNDTKTTIDRIEFYLYVTRRGRSTVLNSEYHAYDSDFILAPGETSAGCWTVENEQNHKPLVAEDGPLEIRIELTDIRISK